MAQENRGPTGGPSAGNLGGVKNYGDDNAKRAGTNDEARQSSDKGKDEPRAANQKPDGKEGVNNGDEKQAAHVRNYGDDDNVRTGEDKNPVEPKPMQGEGGATAEDHRGK